MSVCSRCNSNNNTDIKFCNFCGARMRSSISFDVYGTLALKTDDRTSFHTDDEPVNNKLAYRYFIKGRQAFSGGDFTRATLMFQCALDANPSDLKVRSFLERAREMKMENSRTRFPKSVPSPMDTHIGDDVSIPVRNTQETEPVDMAPLLRHDFSVNRVFTGDLDLRDVSFEREPVKASESPVRKGTIIPIKAAAQRDESMWEVMPSSPSELLDGAPEEGYWNDIAATAAAIIGVIIFGLVLTL